MTRAIIYNDGGWRLAIYDREDLLARIELRHANAWLLLRSLVEMLGA